MRGGRRGRRCEGGWILFSIYLPNMKRLDEMRGRQMQAFSVCMGALFITVLLAALWLDLMGGRRFLAALVLSCGVYLSGWVTWWQGREFLRRGDEVERLRMQPDE